MKNLMNFMTCISYNAKSFIGVVFLFLFGCTNTPDKKVIPDWTSEILGPLVKTTVTGEQLTSLSNLSIFSFSTLYEFGYGSAGEQDVIIPETTFPAVTKREQLNTEFTSMELDGGVAYFKFSNQLPVNIKQGAVITISQNNTVLLTDTISRNIDPITGSYTSRIFNLNGKTILPEATIQVTNLGTNGSQTPVRLTNADKLIVEFFIKDVKIKAVTLKPGSYQMEDTSAFNLNGRVIDTRAISGNLISYVKNNFPFNAEMQFYFLDENFLIKDSMFIAPAIINPSTAQLPETVFNESFSSDKFANINNCRYIFSQINIYSDQEITIRNTNSVEYQLVGDLKFNVEN